MGVLQQARRARGGDKNQGTTCGKRLCPSRRLDFEETFAPVARLVSIRILLAYAAHHSFRLFQMDVKSVFLINYGGSHFYDETSLQLGYVDIRQ